MIRLKRVMLLTGCICLALSKHTCGQDIPATIDPARIVLVKADDFRGPAQQWTNFIQVARSEGIKVGLGVIVNNGLASNLDPGAPQWMQDQLAAGDVEFWLHGWNHSTSEFVGLTVAADTQLLTNSENWLNKNIGKSAIAFGPPNNTFDTNTIAGINATPALRLFFTYYGQDPNLNSRVTAIGIISEADGVAMPNATKFVASFPNGPTGPVALQFHPPYMDVPHLYEFQKIVEFLKTKGYLFLTPTEFIAYKDKVKLNQTLTFNALTNATYGDPVMTLSATASSALPIFYTSSNLSVATISGSTVTIVGAGSTTITASIPGNAIYNAAAPGLQTLTVVKASQTITFNSLTNNTYGDAPFALTGTASSGLPVSYSSSNKGVATISGSTVTIVGAGNTNITAVQAGNANYNAANNSLQPCTVAKRSLAIKANDASRIIGQTNPAFSAGFTGLINSDKPASIGLAVSFACAATSTSLSGTYPVVPSGAATTANYSVTYQNGTLTVLNKTIPTLTWSNPVDIVNGTALSGTQLNATSTVSGTFVYSPSAGTVLKPGNTQILSVTFTPNDLVNYASTTKSVSINVLNSVPDTIPPTVVITAPTSTATFATTSPSLNLAGTASDNVSVTQVTWSNNRGGRGKATATTTWTVTNIALSIGQNVITVFANDLAGNIGKAILTVTYTLNQPPVITSTAMNPVVPSLPGDVIEFTVAANDPDGDVLSYTWDFGDGATGAGANATHSYSAPGTYSVVVSVSDGKGGIAAASQMVVINPPTALKINFQLDGSSIPTGYLTDTGAVFADRHNGYIYGWNVDVAINARDRNAANSPDQRHDTFIHMQKPNAPNAAWKIGLPNGAYTVHAVCGDPSYFDSVYKLDIGGVLTVDGKPSATTRWFEGTQTVFVTDGFLELSSATGSVNNKIDFIEISSVSPKAQQTSPEALDAAPLMVSKLQIKLTYGKHGGQTFHVCGLISNTLSIGIGSGTPVSIDVGAGIVNFVLDGRGRAKNQDGTLAFIKSKKGLSFQVSAKGTTWQSAWADGGVFNTTTKMLPIELPVTLTINGTSFGGSKVVKYTSQESSRGLAR